MINLTDCLLVIRVRGTVDLSPDVKKTFELLGLHRKFHATIVRKNPSVMGMLRRIQDYATWGEIDVTTLAEILKRRGRLRGGKRLTEEYLKKHGFESFEKLARAIIEGKVRLKDLPGVKPIFRLHPPSKGFKGTIKKHFAEGGELGYRGDKIRDLVTRMI